MLLLAGMFAANAAEETIVFSDIYGDATIAGIDAMDPIKQGDITITFAKGNANTAPAFNKAKEIRLYGGKSTDAMDGNTMTVEVPDGSTIKSISLAVGTKDKWGVLTADSGTITEDADYNASWAGAARSVVITANRNSENASVSTQNRYKSITIVYDAGVETKCATPKFSLSEGTYYAAKEIELTTSTDGATIVYTINGGAETTYSAPIQISEVGTYAISATAKKDGLENSDVATATFEIKAPLEVSSINDFIMQGESEPAKTVFKWTFPVTVTAKMPNYTYVTDAEGSAMLIYGNQVPEFKRGDVIPAGIVGEYQNYNGLYELTYPEASSFGTVTETKSLADAVMTAGAIAATDQNKVVYLDNVTYEETVEGEKVTAKVVKDATGSINVYYQKAWNIEGPASGTVVDLVAAVALYKETVQVYPIEFKDASSTPSLGGVDNAVASATVITTNANGVVVNAAAATTVNVYNAAGQLVKAVAAAEGYNEISLPAGFYIVRAADATAKVIVK